MISISSGFDRRGYLADRVDADGELGLGRLTGGAWSEVSAGGDGDLAARFFPLRSVGLLRLSQRAGRQAGTTNRQGGGEVEQNKLCKYGMIWNTVPLISSDM